MRLRLGNAIKMVDSWILICLTYKYINYPHLSILQELHKVSSHPVPMFSYFNFVVKIRQIGAPNIVITSQIEDWPGHSLSCVHRKSFSIQFPAKVAEISKTLHLLSPFKLLLFKRQFVQTIIFHGIETYFRLHFCVPPAENVTRRENPTKKVLPRSSCYCYFPPYFLLYKLCSRYSWFPGFLAKSAVKGYRGIPLWAAIFNMAFVTTS